MLTRLLVGVGHVPSFESQQDQPKQQEISAQAAAGLLRRSGLPESWAIGEGAGRPAGTACHELGVTEALGSLKSFEFTLSVCWVQNSKLAAFFSVRPIAPHSSHVLF